ncbi:MAG: ATP-binding protein [Patescibacteria group bacterium]|nr:ATP-binding protein [Patescibacteria group bacterium]
MKEEGKTDPKLYFDTEVKGEVVINADEGKIKQVLSNLIDNSIKYTPVHPNGPSGFVKIIFTLPKDKDVALVTIKDSGAGMSQETMGRLFDKFSRADNASKFNTAGSGLGLYVAKEFISKHNGRLWAESAGEGKGSTFFVELPKG